MWQLRPGVLSRAALDGAAAGAPSENWALIGSWVHSINGTVAQFDVVGLAAYTDVRVVLKSVTSSSAGLHLLRVSTDNGSTFLSASGDYIEIAPTGIETNSTSMRCDSSGTVLSARGSEIIIAGWNLTAPKVAQARTRIDIRSVVIPTSSALNAVRIYNGGASGSLTGGAIYVFAR